MVGFRELVQEQKPIPNLSAYVDESNANSLEEISMNVFGFSGKVMPERANVNISPLQVQVDWEYAGIAGEAIISVGASQVSVLFKPSGDKVDLPTLRNYVENLVRALVDGYGYISGRRYDVEITSVLDPNGSQMVFGVGIPELEKSQNERPLSLQQLVQAINKSPLVLPRALGDLREAI